MSADHSAALQVVSKAACSAEKMAVGWADAKADSSEKPRAGLWAVATVELRAAWKAVRLAAWLVGSSVVYLADATAVHWADETADLLGKQRAGWSVASKVARRAVWRVDHWAVWWVGSKAMRLAGTTAACWVDPTVVLSGK